MLNDNNSFGVAISRWGIEDTTLLKGKHVEAT